MQRCCLTLQTLCKGRNNSSIRRRDSTYPALTGILQKHLSFKTNSDSPPRRIPSTKSARNLPFLLPTRLAGARTRTGAGTTLGNYIYQRRFYAFRRRRRVFFNRQARQPPLRLPARRMAGVPVAMALPSLSVQSGAWRGSTVKTSRYNTFSNAQYSPQKLTKYSLPWQSRLGTAFSSTRRETRILRATPRESRKNNVLRSISLVQDSPVKGFATG